MEICVIGTGYVGLVSGACLADVGNTVWCVDKNAGKVADLKQHRIPIYEPGLEQVVRRNVAEKRLHFTTDLADGLKNAEVCFITVDKSPAHECRVYEIEEEVVQGRRDNTRNRRELARRLREDDWIDPAAKEAIKVRFPRRIYDEEGVAA